MKQICRVAELHCYPMDYRRKDWKKLYCKEREIQFLDLPVTSYFKGLTITQILVNLLIVTS